MKVSTFFFLLFTTSFFSSAFSMEVYIKPPSGATIILDVEPSDNVEAVKAQVQDSLGIALDCQSLMCHSGGSPLGEDFSFIILQNAALSKDFALLLMIANII